MGFLSGLGKFIKDGGFFGLGEGYDSKNHGGKPYDFSDLKNTTDKIVGIKNNVNEICGKSGVPGIGNTNNLLEGK